MLQKLFLLGLALFVQPILVAQCILETPLIPDNYVAVNRFGGAVHIQDGLAIASVGEPESACVFSFNGSEWLQAQLLTGVITCCNESYGVSVAISSEIALVGASFHDVEEDGWAESGAVYVYRFNGLEWEFEQELFDSDLPEFASFGKAVAISGDEIFVGAPHHGLYIYQFDGASWFLSQHLEICPGFCSNIGVSVAVDSDLLIVGSYWNDSIAPDAGAAYIYRKIAGLWTFEQILTASDADAGDNFGSSVAISGTMVLIGSPRDDNAGSNSGSAYIFEFDGTTWEQQQKIAASIASTEDYFGTSVDISSSHIVVGTALSSTNGADSGAVFVYQHDGISWVESNVLTPSNNSPGDNFGYSVSLFENQLIASSPFSDLAAIDSGAAYVFNLDPEVEINSLSPSQNLCLHSDSQLEVTIDSMIAVEFQWDKDGIDIPGATSNELVLNNLQFDDVGEYSVKILNDCGFIVGGPISVSLDYCFYRGDINGDQSIDIADSVFLLSHLFSGGLLPCEKAGDVNDDGVVNIADPIYGLAFLFSGGMPIPAPTGACGLDLTLDSLGCDFSCL